MQSLGNYLVKKYPKRVDRFVSAADSVER